jgi:hypothetical protein
MFGIDFFSGSFLEILASVALFFIFIYLVYQGVKLLFRYLIIAFASALFPIVLIKLFGMALPLTLGTILAFVYLGIIAYTIYLVLGLAEKIGKFIAKLFGGSKKKKEESED